MLGDIYWTTFDLCHIFNSVYITQCLIKSVNMITLMGIDFLGDLGRDERHGNRGIGHLGEEYLGRKVAHPIPPLDHQAPRQEELL